LTANKTNSQGNEKMNENTAYEYRISYCHLTRRIDASLYMETNVDEGKVLPWQELLMECVDEVIVIKNKQEKEIQEEDFV